MKTFDSTSFRVLGLLSIAFTVLFVSICLPAAIYSANEVDFGLPLTTLLAVGLPWALLAVLLLSVPLTANNRSLLMSVSAAWFALGVSVWVSASFLIADVGLLDGRTEIAVPLSQELLSVVILFLAAAISFFVAFRVPRRALVAIACLGLAQLGAALFQVATASPRGADRLPEADTAAIDRLFRFSEEKNVLVIVLDTFQSTLFEDYLQKNPEIRSDFSGFTFYRNTTGSAPTTYASMPPIHSGVRFDPARPLQESYQELVRSDSFVARLARSGYEASLINPVTGVCPEGAQCFEDYQVGDLAGRAVFGYLSLLDVSLLRAAPGRLKSWIFDEGAWRIRRLTEDVYVQARPTRHQRLLKRFGEGAHVSSGSAAVKFLHLMTTHPPIELNDSCEPLLEPKALTRANFALPVTCSIHTVRDVFDRLKALDVYDASFIAVIADHGANVLPGPQSSRVGGAAMPLFLVKPPRAKGVMQVSDEPAEIRDLAATVCKETGDCQSLDGVPLDELSSPRQRSYFHYVWRHEYWSNDRIQGVKEFQVDGPVWESSSWSRRQTAILPMDEDVPFNASFPAQSDFLDWGWSLLEPWGVWSDGPSALLSFSTTSAPRVPTELVLDTTVYVRPETPTLTMALTANDQQIGSWEFRYPETEATVRARIPPEAWSQGNRMSLHVQLDRAVPLEDLHDPPGRMLGVGLRSLRLESAPRSVD